MNFVVISVDIVDNFVDIYMLSAISDCSIYSYCIPYPYPVISHPIAPDTPAPAARCDYCETPIISECPHLHLLL